MTRQRGTAGTLYLALVSVILAWAVWFITRQEVRDEEVFTITVEAVIEDAPLLSARVIRDTAEVELTIAGPKGEVAAIRASGERKAVVYVNETHIPPGDPEKQASFKLRDLHFGPLEFAERTQATKMEPAEVRVLVTRFAERDVIVLPPDLPEDEFPDFRLALKHVPQTARVRGPVARLGRSDLATDLDKEQLRRAIERMEDAPLQSVLVDLIPRTDENDETVFGPGVELMEEIVATVEINHLATVYRWVELSLVVSRAAGVAPEAFSFSSVNRTNFLVDGEDRWMPGEGGAPPRALLAFRGAPKKLSLLDEDGLKGIVLVDGIAGTESSRAPIRVLDLPAGVTLERTYPVDVDVRR